MLNKYYVKNFKAFAEAEIELCPLSLLLGPNNTGKTSLAEVLLMMQQTAQAGVSGYRGSLRINGKIVSLGIPEHLFHKKNTDQPLVLGFCFSSQSLAKSLKDAQQDFGKQLYGIYRDYMRYLARATHTRRKGLLKREGAFPPEKYLISFRTPRDFSEPSRIKELLKVLSQLRALETQVDFEDDVFPPPLVSRGAVKDRRAVDESGTSLIDLEMTADLLFGMNEIDGESFTLEFQITYLKKSTPNLALSRIVFLWSDRTVADVVIDAEEANVSSVTSDLISKAVHLKNYRPSLTRRMTFNTPVFSVFDGPVADGPTHLITASISQALRKGLRELALYFSPVKLSHVSPVRAYPKRFYFSDQGSSEQLDSDNYIEALRDNDALREKANKWLSRFGISVKVEKIREVLHRAAIKERGTDLDLDIMDVGFGVSQVLPVIIQAFLVPSKGLALIEQPEIHLHPKMQADLMDFFVDMVDASRERDPEHPCSFLIETHSVALLRRLRTRLSERNGLKHKNTVAIYGVERGRTGVSRVKRIEIGPTGEFRWPQDFLDAELGDNVAFLKNITGGK